MEVRPDRIFQGTVHDRLSHFLPEDQWVRVIDYWGRTGWKIGYRDFEKGPCQFKGQPERGFGGGVWVLYDHDGSVSGVHQDMMWEIVGS
jgi:hypothetical protein